MSGPSPSRSSSEANSRSGTTRRGSSPSWPGCPGCGRPTPCSTGRCWRAWSRSRCCCSRTSPGRSGARSRYLRRPGRRVRTRRPRRSSRRRTRWRGGACSSRPRAGSSSPPSTSSSALLFLAPAVGEDAGCALLEGVVLPRRVADTSGGAGPRGARGERPATAHGVSGDALPRARTVEVPGLLTFADAGDWRVSAVSAERPLVLERALGAGRIVAVADATVLRNQSLDRGDAAPLVVDLVRAFGVPRFHEGGEGPRARRSAAAYLATSPALLVFCGLALTGALFAWQGHLVPPRALPGPGTDTPGLDAFVDSLAALYAGTRDHARVLERYRELAAARLRRHFGMPPETLVGVLAERLVRDRRLAPGTLRLLVEGAPVAGERGLRDAVRALDALVREASA